MRRPTPREALYAWHSRALAGDRPPVIEGEPQAGWFKTRLVRGGPWCPARIWLHQPIDPETGELTGDEEWRAEVLGERRDPFRLWLSVAGRPISEAEHDDMARRRLHGTAEEKAVLAPVDLAATPVRP